jgi:hypothetical protein
VTEAVRPDSVGAVGNRADDEAEPIEGVLVAGLLATLTPWLIRIASYLTLAGLAGAYGWWVWRRARKLEAAGVTPPPAPPLPPPGPVPPARPRPW